MIVLGVDPGALRMGYAYIETHSDQLGEAVGDLIESGIVSVPRKDDESYAEYRIRLVHCTRANFYALIGRRWPTLIVSELLPAKGGGNFINPQSEAAKVVHIVCQTLAGVEDIPWCEIPANTIKKRLTGNGKATKVGVRNAVIAAFPHLEPRKKELTEVADESDAIGIALVGMGYNYGKAPTPSGSP